MFKLQNMKSHPVLNFLIKIGFFFIIISFVCFYGWNNQRDRDRAGSPTQRFAQLRSGSLNPFASWHYLDNSDLRTATNQAKAEKWQAMPELSPQFQQMIEQQGVMEKLVTTEDKARVAANQVLLDRKAQEMKIHVPLDDVLNYFKSQPGITDDQLDMQGKMSGLGDKHGYVEYLRHMSELDRVKSIKGLAVHASLFELWQEYSLSNDKLVLQVAAYPTEKFESKVNVTTKDLEDYLAAHKADFYVPPMRRYAYIKADREEIRNALKPTPEQLKAYYDSHQTAYEKKAATHIDEITAPLAENQVSTAGMAALNAIRAEAGQKTDWTTITLNLNKTAKDAPYTYSNTWLEDNSPERDPAFMARIKTLAANKATSTIVDQSGGAHLVRVIETRKQSVAPYAEVSARVENDYKDAKADETFKAELERFKTEQAKVKDEMKTSATVHALALRLKVKDELTTRVVANESTIAGIGSFEPARDYLNNLSEGEFSDVITAPGESPTIAAVVQIVEQKDGYDPPLSEVKDKVDLAVRKNRSVELARTAAEQSLALVKQGGDFKTALAAAPKPPFVTSEFTRLEPVNDLGSPLINFKQQTLQINTGSLGLSPYGRDAEKPVGFAVWRVEKIVPPDRKKFDDERQRFEQDYLQVQRETILREWLSDERNQARYHYIDAEERNK